MKRRLALIPGALLILLLVVGTAYAQKDCGDGLPCGKLLWDLPVLPTFASPTPIPTVVYTAVVTNTPAPTSAPTATIAPTGTVMADFSDVGDQLNTLSAVINATDVPVLVSGTPISGEEQYTQLTTDAGSFFGYLRGVQEANFGGFTPFLGLLITTFIIGIATKGASFILPVLAVIVRLILRIVEVIKKLIGL